MTQKPNGNVNTAPTWFCVSVNDRQTQLVWPVDLQQQATRQVVAYYCHACALVKLQEQDGDSNEEQDETDAVSEDNVLEEHIIDVSVCCSLVLQPEQ